MGEKALCISEELIAINHSEQQRASVADQGLQGRKKQHSFRDPRLFFCVIDSESSINGD